MSARLKQRSLLPAVLLVLALVGYFATQERALLRLAPADFACWHHGLGSQPGLYADQPELLVLARSPEEALAAEVTRGRRIEVEGPDWARLFQQLPAVIGRDCWELPGDLCSRVSPGEEDYVNGLFYAADEAPFDARQWPVAAGARYLYLRDDPSAEPLQVMPIAPGQRLGKVEGCRWYYDHWEVPTRFAHPWRGLTPWLLALALLLVLWRPLGRLAGSLRERTPGGEPNLINFRKRSARFSLGVTGLLATGLVGALIYDPRADYIPPLVFVGGFALLTALITSAMLWRSALRQDRILRGEQLLARWQYPPEQWRHQVEAQYQERRAAARIMLGVVGGLMLLIGGGFVLLLRDEASLFVAAVLAGVFALLVLVALVAPARQRRFLLSRPGVVLVAPTGVYLGGEFHDFALVGSRLEGAELDAAQDSGPVLRVSYSYPSRYGRQTAEVRIPVPKGKQSEAQRVLAALNQAAGSAPDDD